MLPPFRLLLVALVLVTLGLVACGEPVETFDVGEPRRPADAGVPTASWSAQAQAGIAAGEYAPRPDGPNFRATNRAHDLRASFTSRGVAVTNRAGAGEVTLALRAWGRDSAMNVAETVPPEEGPCLSGGEVDAFGQCLRRVHYVRPGLVEWWENRPEGLEQGFTVIAAPDGDDPLVFELALTGAIADVENDGEALLVREAGDPLRFSKLVAWDERGRGLPTWMEETAAGLRLVVDDSGAIGMVTVDPLLTTESWTADGDQADAYFGYSVASAGDVNGDGFGDVVVGAYGYDNGEANEGRAYLYLGSSSGLSAAPAWTAEADQADAQFGRRVAPAGDVNGDGYGDVVVGAPEFSNGEALEGRAYLYYGSSTGLEVSASWTAEADQADAAFGYSVASAGDVNGDGYADVVVGAPAYDNGETDEGRAYIYLGSSYGLSTTASWTAEAEHNEASFGWSVASAGDVDGNGYGDVIVGARTYENGESIEGRAYVYLGSPSGVSPSEAWLVESNQAEAYLGQSVASAGDVNGDGYGDVVIGAYHYDNGSTNEGQAYVYLGSLAGLATSAAWVAESDQADARFGVSVASAGDVNGDGYGDVVIGSHLYDNGESGEGRAELYLGSSSGLATSAAWTAESNQAFGNFGTSVASAGDVNGDGYGDVVVGAYYYDSGATNEGRAYVYLGAASGLATTESWTAESDQASARFGNSVASAGDVNGDGYGDVVVAAYAYDNGETDEGRVYVYLGSSSGLATTAAWTAESNQAYAYFGRSVASAGDVNGDGYGDVVVGAYYYVGGPTDFGRAYVYLGSSSGLATSAAWTAESDQSDAHFGTSVASAGDVNGDGYGDVAIGASYYDNGEADEGRVYVYLGSPAGLSTSAAWTAESDQDSARFGTSVASAGDVNGDGYGDVVVGAPYYDSGETDEGLAYLYLGSPTGLSTSPAWTAESDQVEARFGISVGSAGDVNGDGYGDVVVGAYLYHNGQSGEGRAYVYLGSASGLATSASWTGESDQSVANFGNSVASAGDVNGDGYGDLVVGAYNYGDGQAYEGSAYLYLGSSSGLATTAAWIAEKDQSYAYFGSSVASAGDVNGDGFGDVIIGAPNYDNGSSEEGAAFLYMGNGADGTTPLARAAQARQPGSTTPITPGLAATSASSFDVSIALARTSWGLGNVKIQVEAKPLGTPFDSTGLQTSASFTSSGLTGANLQQSLTGLTGSTGYHWRARVLASPAEGRPQGWGPWHYGGLSGDSQGGHVFTLGETYFVDADGDGYGVATTTLVSRAASVAGYANNSADCDDTSVTISPLAAEIVADGIDQDCDGVDACYTDDDGDNYGTTIVIAGSSLSCDTGVGSATATDCDDTADTISPDSTEICDPLNIDEDCDGLADDSSATGQNTFYADIDGDGHGAGSAMTACDPPSGYVTDNTDCDDTSATISPAAPEVCDPANTDEDCDGLADDLDLSTTTSSMTSYALDADGDGYGGSSSADFCELPAGYSTNSTDCDDTSATIYPAAAELPGSGVDEDCDGAELCYVDADSDGYRPDSSSTIVTADLDCDDAGEAGTSIPIGDCDDDDPTYHPAAPESDCADPNDYNCDGVSGLEDTDADGFSACEECDDTDAAVYPGAAESAGDLRDQDCDGLDTCYLDADDDGARSTTTTPGTTLACDGPMEALASADEDCDDRDPSVHPDSTELPGDTLDSDCDGSELCYYDADDDGYVDGLGLTVLSTDADCDDTTEALDTTLSGDCNDADPTYHPGAAEADCADPNDYNCDGSAGYNDADNDGFGACEECDDADASVNPNATEMVGDRIDQDCDGAELCYLDADDDGHRPDATSTVSTSNLTCDGSGEAVATDPSDDCNDTDASVNPDRVEIPGDELDQDCDGDELCHVDADDDGYVADTESTVASADLRCDGPGEATTDAASGDCDDTSNAVNPAAEERCDGLDNDCDGTLDLGAVDEATWYADADGDGYTSDLTITACNAPDGYVADTTELDCDDADNTTYPGATDPPDDGLDQDCDGLDSLSDSGTPSAKLVPPPFCGCGVGTSGPGSLALLPLLLLRRRRYAGAPC